MKLKALIICALMMLPSSVFSATGQKLADSILVAYTNLYADSLRDADSVIARVEQGTSVIRHVLTRVSLGVYHKVVRIDSTGLIPIRITAYDPNGFDDSVTVAGWAGNEIFISQDTVYLVHTNIVNDSLYPPDSVKCRLHYGSTVDTFTVPSISRGVNEIRKVISPSKGLLYAYFDVYDWDGASHKLTYALSGFVQPAVSFFTPPTSTAKCRLWGYIYNKINGVGRAGLKLKIRTQNNVRYGAVPIYQFVESVTTDANGYWEAIVFRSDSLLPARQGAYNILVTDTMEFFPVIDAKGIWAPNLPDYQVIFKR